MKRLALLVAMSLGACQFGYTQGVALPAGFPEYVDTGDKERDMADLAARKQAWAEANPVELQRYLQQYAKVLPISQGNLEIIPIPPKGLNNASKQIESEKYVIDYGVFMGYSLGEKEAIINRLDLYTIKNLPERLSRGAIVPKVLDYSSKSDYDVAFRLWAKSNEH